METQELKLEVQGNSEAEQKQAETPEAVGRTIHGFRVL